MKTILLLPLFLSNAVYLKAQAQWNFTSKKITDSIFEIHLTAILDKGWHLYSQAQPPEAIVEPSVITFDQSPDIQLQGIVTEKGDKELYENKEVGIKAYQYKSQVDFIQLIKLKELKKITVNGHISFILCSETTCLPVTTKSFSLLLSQNKNR